MPTISALPDELLVEIFEFLPVRSETSEWLCTWRLSVMLVCRRWHQLFEPQLYRTLMLYYGASRIKVQEITKVLKRRPDLCKHIKKVHLGKGPNENDEVDYNEFFDLVLPLSGLEVLECTEKWMPILNKIAETKTLVYLYARGLSLCTILRCFGTTEMRSLRLSHAYWRMEMIETSPITPVDPLEPSPLNLQHLFPEIEERIGTLKRLRLKYCVAEPSHIAAFLRWPAGLSTFKFRTPIRRYQLSEIQQLLEIHKDSLRHITLGRINNDHRRIIIPPLNGPTTGGIPPPPPAPWTSTQKTTPLNFTSFPSLAHLTINTHNDIITQSATHIGHILSSPSLKHLTLDFNPENGLGASFQSFTSNSLPWFKEMVLSLQSHQSHQSHQSTSSTSISPFTTGVTGPVFDSLKLDFRPWRHDSVGNLITNLNDKTYPWDYLEQIKTTLWTEHKVKVSWPELDVSRDDWDRGVELAVKKNERRLLEREDYVTGGEVGMRMVEGV